MDFGYDAEIWTTPALTKHIQVTAKDAGFEKLSTISESGLYRILVKAEIKPFRIRDYCKRRDPDFDGEIHNVLLVYKQLSLQFDKGGNLPLIEDEAITHILSYSEKLEIHAIANTTDDLSPAEGNGVIKRDYEYKTISKIVTSDRNQFSTNYIFLNSPYI